jgi:hypothetical protein
MSQNHRRDARAIDPTKKSSLFEVPLSGMLAKQLLNAAREAAGG